MTPESARTALARQMQKHGWIISLQRAGVPTVDILCRIRDYRPDELVGGVIQGDRQAIIPAECLERAGWPGAPSVGDQIIDGGATMTVEAVDASTRRIAGVVIGYNLTVRG